MPLKQFMLEVLSSAVPAPTSSCAHFRGDLSVLRVESASSSQQLRDLALACTQVVKGSGAHLAFARRAYLKFWMRDLMVLDGALEKSALARSANAELGQASSPSRRELQIAGAWNTQ